MPITVWTTAAGDSQHENQSGSRSSPSPARLQQHKTSPPSWSSGDQPSQRRGDAVPRQPSIPGFFGQAWTRALGDLCVHGINLNEIRHNVINDWLGKVVTKHLERRRKTGSD